MPALILSEAERARRDKVVAQLSADNENVVLVAMNVLKRMAAEHKVPVYEFILGSPASSSYREIEEARQRAQRAEAAAREATARAERAEREAQSRAALPETWRVDLKGALDHHLNRRRFLSGWQENFVTDLLSRGQNRLSAKQTLKVSEVLEHYATLPSQRAKPAFEDWENEL